MASTEGTTEVAKPAPNAPSYSKLIYSAIESMKERAGGQHADVNIRLARCKPHPCLQEAPCLRLKSG